MNDILNDIEVRILGCLVEKGITTPDYYPLTLNSLVAACNQKSNRNPVVSYEEAAVEQGLDALKKKGVVHKLFAPGSRAAKYSHSFPEEFRLIPQEVAILCELMLRGPQTAGELRARADRMYAFKGLEEVDETVRELMDREQPLVIKLRREPGKREERYTHLLSGTPQIDDRPGQNAEVIADNNEEENSRITKLEQEVSGLRIELEELKKGFETFKAQF